MSITRRQLRRDILTNLGDLRLLKATASLSNVTFIDTDDLVGETDAYKGREVLFTGGTAANLGEIRYVTGSSTTQRALGFGVSLPATPAVGDECEMINTRGIMVRFAEVHNAINQAIRGISGVALSPATTDEQTFARGTAIELPADFATVENVQYLDSYDSTLWRSVPKAPRINGSGWALDPASRTVVVGGQAAWDLNERTIKVWGLAEPAVLLDDGDETPLDAEWLRVATQAALAFALYLRMPTPERKDALSLLEGKEHRLRRKVVATPGPFSEFL